jgi:hypothetical protein
MAKGKSKTQKARTRLKQRLRGNFAPKHRISHFFKGQTPHTPDNGDTFTICCGYIRSNGERHICGVKIKVQLGVLQARCSECYRMSLINMETPARSLKCESRGFA